MKDFFISYNRADKTWAEWMAWVLEEHGYTVIIQAWDFRPGGNFILDMQRATDESQRTIMVLSEDYLKAAYTQPEWAAAFKQDPTSQERVLIPVRVGECKPTGMLAPLVYVDLVGKDEAEAEALLLDALKDRAKPETRPTFPGGTPTQERIIQEKVAFPQKQATQVKWQVVLDFKLEGFFDHHKKVDSIVTELKRLSEDRQLKEDGRTCENSSTFLTLKGTEEGFKVIESLFHSGQLLEICGLRIEQVMIAHSSSQSTPSQAQPSVTQTSFSQVPSMSSQPKPLTALDRLKLIRKLSALPVGQFEELVTALNPPSGILPQQAADQSSRAAQLLKWVEGPTGRGLAELEEIYAAIADHP